MAERLKVIFISFMLIGIGIAAILSGEIPAHSGKGVTPLVTSFPYAEPYVPFIGGVLIAAGIYMIIRAVYPGRKK
jgi:hypothetical protein